MAIRKPLQLLDEVFDFREDEGLIRLHDQRVVILSAAAIIRWTPEPQNPQNSRREAMVLRRRHLEGVARDQQYSPQNLQNHHLDQAPSNCGRT